MTSLLGLNKTDPSTTIALISDHDSWGKWTMIDTDSGDCPKEV